MRLSLLRPFLAPLLGLLLVAGPASAQKKGDSAAVTEAKAHFEKGLRLYKEGAHREALSEFQKAHKLVPRASVLRNIAQCHRDLRQFSAAHASLTELLNAYGGGMRKAEQAELRRVIADLAALTGTVLLMVNEPDAQVEVDGKETGLTPLKAPVRVNVGTHTIIVSKPGFDPFSKQIEMQAGEEARVEIAIKREVLTGHLVVTPSIPDAKVRLLVDDKDVGPLPWEGDVPAGSHRLAITGTDVTAPPRTVEVTKGARIEVSMDVKKQAGHLVVDPHNAEAQIFVDGTLVGKGVWEGDLKSGQHEISVNAPGFEPYKRAILLHEGERRVESFVLASQGQSRSPTDYRGIYAYLTPSLAASVAPSNEIETKGCKACAGLSIGPASTLGLGYSFGWVGVEALGVFRFAITSESKQNNLSVLDYTFGGGVGARVTTKSQLTRATFGVGFAFVHDQIVVHADQTAERTASGNAPMLLLDTGLLFGSTPGAKFKLGILGSFEFVPKPLSTDAPKFRVLEGTQFFFGPLLGVQFGS